MNNPFKILTDNVACTYIVKKADLSPRLARWAVQLNINQENLMLWQMLCPEHRRLLLLRLKVKVVNLMNRTST